MSTESGTRPESPTKRDEGWLASRERGSTLAIRLVVFLVTFTGRAIPRGIARIVAFYYALFAGDARRAVRDYLGRVLGRPPSAREIYTQFLRFVQVTLDAFFIVSGRRHYFTTNSNGNEHLEKLRDTQRGGILLGAHLGSFYAMRMRGGQRGLRLYAMVFTKNARRINDALDALDPDNATTLIEIDPESGMDFMLKVRELVEGGALVAILGDRVHGDARAMEADFLGGRARFATGPFLLASMLRCPVYLVFGLHRAPSHYELFCEPFAEQVVLPRKRREEALAEYVQRYADRLAHFARLYPDNWFNFFDFWRVPPTPTLTPPAPAASPEEPPSRDDG